MLEQLVHQLLPGIVFRVVFLQLRIARQQHTRLDVDQRGCHVDKLGAEVEIQLPRFVHVFEVLRGYGRDRDIFDIDLLLAYEVEQKIQRTLIPFQVDV